MEREAVQVVLMEQTTMLVAHYHIADAHTLFDRLSTMKRIESDASTTDVVDRATAMHNAASVILMHLVHVTALAHVSFDSIDEAAQQKPKREWPSSMHIATLRG